MTPAQRAQWYRDHYYDISPKNHGQQMKGTSGYIGTATFRAIVPRIFYVNGWGALSEFVDCDSKSPKIILEEPGENGEGFDERELPEGELPKDGVENKPTRGFCLQNEYLSHVYDDAVDALGEMTKLVKDIIDLFYGKNAVSLSDAEKERCWDAIKHNLLKLIYGDNLDAHGTLISEKIRNVINNSVAINNIITDFAWNLIIAAIEQSEQAQQSQQSQTQTSSGTLQSNETI